MFWRSLEHGECGQDDSRTQRSNDGVWGCLNVPRCVAVCLCVFLGCNKPSDPTREPADAVAFAPADVCAVPAGEGGSGSDKERKAAFEWEVKEAAQLFSPLFPGDQSLGHKKGCCRRGLGRSGRSMGKTVPSFTPKTLWKRLASLRPFL